MDGFQIYHQRRMIRESNGPSPSHYLQVWSQIRHMHVPQSDRLTLSQGDDFLSRRPLAQDQRSWGKQGVCIEKTIAPFRFFSLPPEIRREIIRFAVTESEPLLIKFKSFNRHIKHQRKTRSGHLIDRREYVSPEKLEWGHSRMAILFTCRQAYAEGMPLYYGENDFNITPEVFKSFSDEIPARCLNQIRSIVMPFYHERLCVWPQLANLERLHSLQLVVSILLTGLILQQLKDCRKGVRMLPQLRKFGIDQGWIAGSRHRDQELITAQEEINEYLRLRK